MSAADGEAEEELLQRKLDEATTTTLPPRSHTPSGPSTPSASATFKEAVETQQAQLDNLTSARDLRNQARCSIPGGERGNKINQ